MGINGLCNFALKDLPSNSRFSSDINHIVAIVNKSASLISQLLAYVQKSIYKPILINLNGFIPTLPLETP